MSCNCCLEGHCLMQVQISLSLRNPSVQKWRSKLTFTQAEFKKTEFLQNPVWKLRQPLSATFFCKPFISRPIIITDYWVATAHWSWIHRNTVALSVTFRNLWNYTFCYCGRKISTFGTAIKIGDSALFRVRRKSIIRTVKIRLHKWGRPWLAWTLTPEIGNTAF